MSAAQTRGIEPFFPLSQWIPRVDDRWIVSGITFVIRNGLRASSLWPSQDDLQPGYRLERLGVFNRIFAELAVKGRKPDRLMIDAPHLNVHRAAASLLKGGSTQTYRTHQR